MFDPEDMVPRQTLDDATAGVERLKQKLDEANVQNKKEMETALKSMQWQLRTLQSQCRTAEEQLIRSLERERELRVQLADNDVSAIIGNLREENHALRVDNDYLREQVAILMQDVQMHAELKPELEILKQEVREAGFEHHHALSSLSREKEQLASEASEALSALRNELEIRAQGYEEDTVRVEARTRLLEDHVAELEENLVEARGLVISAEESAKAYSTHNTLLENDMASGGRRIAEQEADINELRERLAGMQQDLQFAEKAHMAGSSQNEQLVAENAEKSELVKSLEDSVKAAEDNGKHELEMLSMHIEDQKRKIATLVGEVQRAENEAKASRDQMRVELKKAEVESNTLRDSLREERERQEVMQEDHRRALDELHEQRRGAESTLSRREEEMQLRIKTLEKELQTTIPESQLVQVQEEALRGKQELLGKLQQTQQEVERLEDASLSQTQRLEAKMREAESVIDDKENRIQVLCLEVKEAEEHVIREQKHRQNAMEQVRALAGDLTSNLKTEQVKPTKMAEATIDILERGLAKCLGHMARARRDDTDASRLSASPLATQRTALGIVLNGTRVDETVPGSPAQVCGMIDTADELIMVDGHKVSALTAIAALRGSDSAASVVSLLLRKSGRGEVVKVNLPRASIDLVKRRQELNEELEELQQKAMQAIAKGAESQAGELLGRIAKEARTLDRMNFELQLQLSAQVSALVEGIETLVARVKTSVLDVDATHQQVHVLQLLTETELRQHSMQDSGPAGRETHKQVQELEGDLKALQEELSASQMLRRECLEDVHELQQRVRELEDEIQERQISQDRLKGTLSRVEDELSEARLDIAQQPYALRAVMEIDFEDTVANAETKTIMDLQLQEDISIALRIPKAQVEVLCYTRGLGTMAEVKISTGMATQSHGNRHDSSSSGKALAEELQKQVADPKSEIHQGPAGKRIKEIEVHGPIAVQAARALRSALLEVDSDLHRTQLDLARFHDKLSEAHTKHRAAIKTEELMKQEIVKDCDARLQAASAGFREQLARALDTEKDQTLKEQASAFKQQAKDHEDAMQRNLLENNKQIAELSDKNHVLEHEIKAVRDNLYGLEVNSSSVRIEAERARDKLRLAEHTTSEMQHACTKVDEIIVPELNSCLMTLSNIESEMHFFHTHCMRARAVVPPANGSSSPSSENAHRSKDCIEKDMSVLRLQLEILSQFSYSDPEVLLRELSAAVAFAEGSPGSQHCTNGGTHGGTQRIKRYDTESSLSPLPLSRLSPSSSWLENINMDPKAKT